MKQPLSKDAILEDLNRIFCEVLLDEVRLTSSTTAADVEGWDSLTHISLMLAVEETFKVRFGLGELDRTKNVGELINVIVDKASRG
jgi:acyl carrier protein